MADEYQLKLPVVCSMKYNKSNNKYNYKHFEKYKDHSRTTNCSIYVNYTAAI